MLVDEMPDAELPQRLDKVELLTVASLKLDDGECMTVEILDFNNELDELIVDVLASNRAYTNTGQRGRPIPVSRVVSCKPRPPAEQPWPYSDPCRGASFSPARFALMATLFLCMTVGSLPLFFLLTNGHYGLQETSAILYTIFVVFSTFAATGRLRRYMFTCPAVQTQVLRLLWRHFGFLVALFALQTAALAVHPTLPDWWNTDSDGKGTPFGMALMLLCFGLGCAQVFTNRSLLDRAHREFSA
jgi:hypothetical protein